MGGEREKQRQEKENVFGNAFDKPFLMVLKLKVSQLDKVALTTPAGRPDFSPWAARQDMPDIIVQPREPSVLPWDRGRGGRKRQIYFVHIIRSLHHIKRGAVRLYRSGKNVNHTKPARVFLLSTNAETTGVSFCRLPTKQSFSDLS